MTTHLTRLFALLVCILASMHLIAQEDTAGFPVITPENVTDLELGYALPGGCAGFDPTGQYVITGYNGVHDILTGEIHLPVTGFTGVFSPDGNTYIDSDADTVYAFPSGEFRFTTEGSGNIFTRDGRYIISSQDGVYDATSGEFLYEISGYVASSNTGTYFFERGTGIRETDTGNILFPYDDSVFNIVFSPDDRYFVEEGAFVYDLESNQQLFEIDDNGYDFPAQVSFSPDSMYLAVEQDGIYTLPDGEKVFTTTDGWTANFSSDGTVVGFADDGIYEVGTWEKLFNIEGGLQGPYFTLDSEYVFVNEWGVYQVETGELLEIPYRYFQVSPNNDLFISSYDGIYELDTWNKLVTFETLSPSPPFASYNAEQTVIAYQYINREFEDSLNSACLLYGVAGANWAYRSGLVQSDSLISAYNVPDGNEMNQISGFIVVYAQTQDNTWYKVTMGNSFEGELTPIWIRADDVTPISMPEGIPIESP